MATRVWLHHAEIDRLLRQPGGAVHREVTMHTRRVYNTAKTLCPVDFGPLRASHRRKVATRGRALVVGRVWATAPDAIYVHAGGGRVRAKHAKALAFRPKGSRKLICRKWVGPAAPQPWLTTALRVACPWPSRKGGRP